MLGGPPSGNFFATIHLRQVRGKLLSIHFHSEMKSKSRVLLADYFDSGFEYRSCASPHEQYFLRRVWNICFWFYYLRVW